MTGRVYTVSFEGVSITAVQDLVTIFTGVKAVKIHSAWLGQITATAVGNLNVSLRRLPATVTAGSAGTAPTPQPLNPGDAAATVTAHANDTTRSTTGGTISYLAYDVCNVINGYLFLPPAEDRPVIAPSQAFVFSLDTAPSGAETFSGGVTVEELF